jgi:hypothetical protein
MNILELIKNQKTIIEVSGVKYNYFHIADFNKINFSYGLCKDGWIVNEDGKLSLVFYDDTNFISFLKLLEISFDDLHNYIQKSLNTKTVIDHNWIELFPIAKITQTCLNMESIYWSELSLNFLLKSKFHSIELSLFLNLKMNEKWVTQQLKHKIQKYTPAIRGVP